MRGSRAKKQRLDEGNAQAKQCDAADQQATAPLLKLGAVRWKHIGYRSGDATDGKAGKADKRQRMHHLRPRTRFADEAVR